jgi:hypothetical protein
MNRITYRSKRRPIYLHNKKPTILLIIDAQKDFCVPGGALYVPGQFLAHYQWKPDYLLNIV